MTKSAPKRLSAEAKKLWRAIVEEFEIDDSAGLLLLENALSAFDEMRAGQAILAKDGPIILDRFSQMRQHPITLVIRDSRNLMLRSLKALETFVDVVIRDNRNRCFRSHRHMATFHASGCFLREDRGYER